MASLASQLIEEVTAHAQSDSLKDAWEICADGTYFPNNLRTFVSIVVLIHFQYFHQKKIIAVVLIMLCWCIGHNMNQTG